MTAVEASQGKTSGTTTFLLGAAVGAFLVGVFWWATGDSDETRSLSFRFPGGSVDLSAAADGSMDHADALQEIYERDYARAGMLEWLETKQVYSLDSRELPDALAALCGSDKGEREACITTPVIRDLRSKMLSHDPPFHYVGEDVGIGVPSRDDQPPVSRAHACSGGLWVGRRIELSNPANGNSVEVVADAGTYTCTGVVKTPDLQLHFETADYLFNEPLREYGEARAVVLR